MKALEVKYKIDKLFGHFSKIRHIYTRKQEHEGK